MITLLTIGVTYITPAREIVSKVIISPVISSY